MKKVTGDTSRPDDKQLEERQSAPRLGTPSPELSGSVSSHSKGLCGEAPHLRGHVSPTSLRTPAGGTGEQGEWPLSSEVGSLISPELPT